MDQRFAEVKDLGEACKKGDIARVTSLLQKHPEVLDSPDRDTRFPYPASCLWSPLGLAVLRRDFFEIKPTTIQNAIGFFGQNLDAL